MRHLLLSLLLLLGVVGTAPTHAAAAAHVMGAATAGHCADGHADCAHACLGCALEPGETAHLTPRLLPADRILQALLPETLRSRAIGRDPPPPRRG